MVTRLPERPSVFISFDGGARINGPGVSLDPDSTLVAGGGAAIWSEADHNGGRTCIAQVVISTPRLRSSMLAESTGLAHAISYLAGACGCPGPISVLGDNFPLVRMAACNARLRSDPCWIEVEGALMLLAGRRWRPQWHAVRRHLNKAADALATQGVFDSLRRFVVGDATDTVFAWCDEEHFAQRGLSVPTSILGKPDTNFFPVQHPPRNGA